jgi:hypothetical protein
LWMSRRSKLPAQPTAGEFELAVVDYLPSKDIRRLAARAGITVEGTGPLVGEARATLAKKIVAAMPVADLAYEIRQIRPGVLP